MAHRQATMSTLPFPEERLLSLATIPRLVRDCNDLGLAISVYGHHCKKVYNNSCLYQIDSFEGSDSWRKDFADEHLVFHYALAYSTTISRQHISELCNNRKKVNQSQGQRVAVLLIEKELNMIFALFGEQSD